MIFETGKYVSIITAIETKQKNNPTSNKRTNLKSIIMNPLNSNNNEKKSRSLNELFFSFSQNINQLETSINVSSSMYNLENACNSEYVSKSRFIPNVQKIEYNSNSDVYLTPIKLAYEHSSSHLLYLLIHDSKLTETFNSIKHYMLLSMSDFIVIFMDKAKQYLSSGRDSETKKFNKRLKKSLDDGLGAAMDVSTASSDKILLKNDLKVELFEMNFQEQIYRLNNFLQKQQLYDNYENWNSEHFVRQKTEFCYEALVCGIL